MEMLENSGNEFQDWHHSDQHSSPDLPVTSCVCWEKEMAPHSSVLAWRIPGTGELGGLPSMGSHRVGHDWSDLAAAVCAGSQSSEPQFPHLLNKIISKCVGILEDQEKAMAPHSSTLAWKIPWTEEPGGLQSMGSWRVGHDWSDLAAAESYLSRAITEPGT